PLGLVAARGPADELGAGRRDDRGHGIRKLGRRLRLRALPRAEVHEVVRPAGLGARADDGALPASEGLPPHDRAGDAAVDVEIAGLDRGEPGAQLLGVERVEARGEAIIDLILQADRLLEGRRPHDAEDRPEEFGEVVVAARGYARADAGRP